MENIVDKILKAQGRPTTGEEVTLEAPILPLFVVSVLALDGIDMTRKCVDAVLKGGGNFTLILTDNGCVDGTAEYFRELARNHQNIIVNSPGSNTGFIPPNNRAFEMARELGAEYFITLNNDLVVPKGWLEKLHNEFKRFPKAAIVGPRGTISHLNAGMLGFSRDKLDFIEGSLMCVKVDLVQGPLFSDYLDFIYHEDSDLSLRMQRAGYTIHQADFTVVHHNGSTCTRHPLAVQRCRQANMKNQAVMLKKWAHWNKVRCFDFQIVVRRRFAVGDVLLATPVIHALKKLWPLCPIDVETNCPDIFKGNPDVRRAAPQIGINSKTMVIGLDGAYERTPNIHVLESYARAAGVTVHDARLRLYPGEAVPPGELSEGKWAAVHVGPSTWPSRNWPMDRWGDIIRHLKSIGFKVMTLGEKNTPGIHGDLDKRGQKGIQELAAMLKKCSLFVGIDSFPSHAAAAMEVPCVVLYGITNPDCFRVATAPHVAVRSDPKHKNTGRRNTIANVTFIPADGEVMRTISVDAVKQAINTLV